MKLTGAMRGRLRTIMNERRNARPRHTAGPFAGDQIDAPLAPAVDRTEVSRSRRRRGMPTIMSDKLGG